MKNLIFLTIVIASYNCSGQNEKFIDPSNVIENLFDKISKTDTSAISQLFISISDTSDYFIHNGEKKFIIQEAHDFFATIHFTDIGHKLADNAHNCDAMNSLSEKEIMFGIYNGTINESERKSVNDCFIEYYKKTSPGAEILRSDDQILKSFLSKNNVWDVRKKNEIICKIDVTSETGESCRFKLVNLHNAGWKIFDL